MGRSSSQPRTFNTLTRDQRGVSSALASAILDGIDRGATPSTVSGVAGLDPAFGPIYSSVTGYDPAALDTQIGDSLRELLGGGVSFTFDRGAPQIRPNTPQVQGYAPTVTRGSPTTARTVVGRTPFARGSRLGGEATQNYFERSVATPALQAFDRNIAPRINAAFAGRGATFSTRRGIETADQLGQLNTTLSGELARAVREDQLAQFNADQQAAQQENQLAYGYDTAQAQLDASRASQDASLAASADQWQQTLLQNLLADNARFTQGTNANLLQNANQFDASTLAQAQQWQTQLAAQLAENARQRQQQAVGQAQQFAVAPYTRAAMLQSLLAPYQQNAQDRAAFAFNESQRTARENNPFLRLGQAFVSSPQTQTYMQQNSSPLGQYLGIAGTAIGAGAGLMTGNPLMGGLLGAGIGGSVGGNVGGLLGGTVSPNNAAQGLAGAGLTWATARDAGMFDRTRPDAGGQVGPWADGYGRRSPW